MLSSMFQSLVLWPLHLLPALSSLVFVLLYYASDHSYNYYQPLGVWFVICLFLTTNFIFLLAFFVHFFWAAFVPFLHSHIFTFVHQVVKSNGFGV